MFRYLDLTPIAQEVLEPSFLHASETNRQEKNNLGAKGKHI
ncbi:hypothetical protein FVEN_g12696 [Fusarium venenatum]|nr:hypothetical protein FVEN_g12696 [Fusarium venenatum]